MKPTIKELFKLLDTTFASLRPWQVKFSEYWEKCANSNLIGIQTPTGSGKTCVSLLILEQGRMNSKKCVYLTHTKQLVERIAEEAHKLKIKYVTLGSAKGITGDRYRKRKQVIDEYNDYEHIIISTFPSFLMTPDFPLNVDILVIDDVDLFYNFLRNFFSIKIKKIGSSHAVYKEIITAISDRSYSIIEKIKERTASYFDGDIIFPHDYAIIKEIITKNIMVLKEDKDFNYSYNKFSEFIEYYLWYLNDRELSLEPYIFPLNEIKKPNTNNKRFENIEKIILISATLGSPDMVAIELGIEREKTTFITENKFKEDGIDIIMGDKLIFPIIDASLSEVSPFSEDFIIASKDFILRLTSKLEKVLILCWEKREKLILANFLKGRLPELPIFDFDGKNYEILKEFSDSDNGFLLIANRYFGLDFPNQSCKYCVLTRLPVYTSNYDIVLDKYLKDKYFYYALQARKLIQSLGRINRGENDYTTYFILDNRFTQAITDKIEFYPLLDEGLKLRLNYSKKVSSYGDIEIAISESQRFTNNKGDSRDKLIDFLNSRDIKEDDIYKIDKDILSQTYKNEVKAWNYLYNNNFEKSLEYFQKIIDELSKSQHLDQYLRKIEQCQFYKYLIYFKLELRGREDFSKQFKNTEEHLSNSKILTWLNNVVLYSVDDIKIHKTDKIMDPSKTQKKFEAYSKDPINYLGDLFVLEEIKLSLDTIKEVLENLASAQKSSPLRTLAIEFEFICHNALKKRLPDIYDSLKINHKLDVSNTLNAFKVNFLLRKSIFNLLFDDKRSLRNTIVHCKDESKEIKYEEVIRYCNELKTGIRVLLKDLYFSDMLLNSKDLISNLQKECEDFLIMSADRIRNKMIKRWADEKINFQPQIDEYDEITSYSGLLKFQEKGNDYEIKVNMRI